MLVLHILHLNTLEMHVIMIHGLVEMLFVLMLSMHAGLEPNGQAHDKMSDR